MYINCFIHFFAFMFYETDSDWNKENVVPGDNGAYQMQSLSISDQEQESLLAGTK